MRTLAVSAAAIAVWFEGPHLRRSLTSLAGDDLPDALGAVPSVGVVIVGSWVLLVIGASAVPGLSLVARAVTPRAFQGLLIGGAAGTLALAPAHAETSSGSLDGLQMPDRVATAAPTLTVETAPPARVAVRAGDTLWRLVAGTLGTSSPPAISAEVARWHTANRAVIGPDPDLIRPGQVLEVPDAELGR